MTKSNTEQFDQPTDDYEELQEIGADRGYIYTRNTRHQLIREYEEHLRRTNQNY